MILVLDQFVTNTTVLDRTKEESIISRIRRWRMAVFGHIRRLPEQAPAHAALHQAVDTRSGRKPDNREQWRRARGRPRTHGSDKSKLTLDFLLTPQGTLLMIIVGEAHNDSRWLRVPDDDDDDDTRLWHWSIWILGYDSRS